jgi:protein-ribulosamine 3-kinase
MCEGQFESLKAIHKISPTFVPEPYCWGAMKSGIGYFLLTEFREVGQQPPDPPR